MESDVIIMDEPTAALSSEEVRRLFEIIADLKKQGVTVIYISHRLDEIFEIGDYVTVLRDGKMVGTKPRSEIASRKELIKMMIGKFIMEDYVPGNVDRTQPVVEVVGLTNAKLRNVSFTPLQGRNPRPLRPDRGRQDRNCPRAVRRGPGRGLDQGLPEPEDDHQPRHGHSQRRGAGSRGTAHAGPLYDAADLRQRADDELPADFGPGLRQRRQAGCAHPGLHQKLSIACLGENQVTAFLSGGNQQKVVLAKCLNSEAGILLLDEPTRGVDVGAKQEIFAIIRQLARQGNSVIVFSSELPEVLGLCDRIGLLYDGALKTLIENDGNVNSHDVLHIVTGGEIYEHVD